MTKNDPQRCVPATGRIGATTLQQEAASLIEEATLNGWESLPRQRVVDFAHMVALDGSSRLTLVQRVLFGTDRALALHDLCRLIERGQP